MNKKKAVLLTALIFALLIASVPAFAANFDFNMVKGQSTSSSIVRKTNTRPFVDVTSTGGNQVQGVELVYFRGRKSNLQYASNLAESYFYGRFTPSYFAGAGVNGNYYYLFGSLGADNPFNTCRVYGTWQP